MSIRSVSPTEAPAEEEKVDDFFSEPEVKREERHPGNRIKLLVLQGLQLQQSDRDKAINLIDQAAELLEQVHQQPFFNIKTTIKRAIQIEQAYLQLTELVKAHNIRTKYLT